MISKRSDTQSHAQPLFPLYFETGSPYIDQAGLDFALYPRWPLNSRSCRLGLVRTWEHTLAPPRLAPNTFVSS